VLAEPHKAAEGYITITFVDNDMPALSGLVVVENLLKVQPLLCTYECIRLRQRLSQRKEQEMYSSSLLN
jgi:hypothetical protein